MKSIKFLEDNGVNIKRSLELFGDSVTYNETIGEFLVGIHDKINKLIKFMQNRDMANYAIMAHSMKSDANNFGFEKLANMALEHETHSKAGDMYYINEHINDLIRETNNAIILIASSPSFAVPTLYVSLKILLTKFLTILESSTTNIVFLS